MMARRFVVRWHRVAAGPCLWLSVWLAAASASNCSRGGQTGDGSDLVPPAPTDTPAIATDLACAVREVVVEDFDARLEEVGFSARQLLDLAVQRADEAGPVAARWSPDGVVETQPESGLSSLELSFTDEAGKVVLLLPETGDAGTASDLQGAAEPVPVEAGSSRALQSFGCAPALVVEVDARLVSARGALDERFRARLVASVLDVISFDAELELGSLRGSLQVQLEGETLDEAQATLSGALTPYGSSGSLQASISSNLDDYIVVQNAMLLQWPPPEDCQDVTTSRGSLGTFRVTEDLPAPDFDAEVQALFSEVQLPLTWSDGSRTELSFAVIDSEPQCLSVNPADGAPALGYLATLRVDAQDGSWTGSFPVSVVAYASVSGELALVDLVGALRVPAEEVDALGMPRLDVGDALELDSTISALWSPQAGTLSGSVTVAGLGVERCEPMEPSAADAGTSDTPASSAGDMTHSPDCIPDYTLLTQGTFGP